MIQAADKANELGGGMGLALIVAVILLIASSKKGK